MRTPVGISMPWLPLPLMHSGLANQWLNAVLTAMGEAVVGTTMDDTVIIWNSEAQRLCGYSSQEMIGRPHSLLSPSGKRTDARALGEEVVASGQASSRKAVWRCKDGSIRRFTVGLSPVCDAAGHLSGIIETVRLEDVAEGSRNAVDTIPKEGSGQPESLAQRAQLSARDQAIDQLAHELSEPMTAIANYLVAGKQLLNRGAQADTVKMTAANREALKQMSRAADVLRQLRSLVLCGGVGNERD